MSETHHRHRFINLIDVRSYKPMFMIFYVRNRPTVLYVAKISDKNVLLKNHAFKPPNDLNFQYISLIGSKIWNHFNLKFYHQRAQIYVGFRIAKNDQNWPKLTSVNSSLLVVEFQSKIYLTFWTLVMKYIESLSHLEVWKNDFSAKTFFGPLRASYGST